MAPALPPLRRARTLAALPVLLLVVVVACFPGARAPQVPPNGTLGLRTLGEGSEESGPIRVVFASPKGKLSGPSEITVLFNKAMRPLDLAGKETPFPARIEPAIEGTWQWAGTRAGTFVPARAGGGGSFRMPRATAYKVTIPQGTRALDGDAMAEDYTFQFETERPRLVNTSPHTGADGLRPDQHFDLYFDQPLDEAELARHLAVSAAGAPVAFTVSRRELTNDKRFVVAPKHALPLDSTIEIKIGRGLRGKEGPLTVEQEHKATFETYGPLVVEGVRCSSGLLADKKCSAQGGLIVQLSNPVKLKELKQAISIDPPVKLSWPSWMGADDAHSSFDLGGRFLPGKSYTVHVRGGLKDEHGQTLSAAFTQPTDFGDLEPVARIGITDGVLEANAKREVTVGHINADDLEIGTLKLDEDDILQIEDGKLTLEQIAKRAGYSARAVARGRKNVLERHRVAIDALLGGPKARGAFAITARYTSGRETRTERRVAHLTDLGVSAKVSRQGTLVLVTRLGSAAPVAGAEVKIRRPGQLGVLKTTDTQGFAAFTPAEFTPVFEDEKAVIFARTSDDFSYKAAADNLYNYEFTPGEDGPIGLMFDDRGIYRPGEIVHLKGILRDPTATGMTTPAGRPVSITVEGPEGDTVATLGVTTTAFGTFSADVKIPATGRLGTYWARATSGGASIAEETLEVGEFRPAEFKVAVESDRPSYVRGDAAKWTGRGDYFYGAPMSGAKAELSVSRSSAYFTPPGHASFAVDDSDYQRELRFVPAQHLLASSAVALDASGVATSSAVLSMPGQKGAERVTCSLDVTDVSRQVVSTSTTAIVHPAEHYVGIESKHHFVEAGAKVSPSFVAVRPSGERVVGAPLRVSFIKRTWAVAKQGSGDRATSVSSPVDAVVASCALVSARAPVSCDLTPPDAGRYIIRASSEDARKNVVASSTDLYVSGDSSDALAIFSESDGAGVELIADKQKYDVGDKAKILVKSPWKGADALVTVERAGIYEKRRVKLTGAAPTIEVAITEAMRPNAFVSVMVLKGRSKQAPPARGKPDVGAPAFVLGYANLLIDPESKRLDVEVKPAKMDMRPGDEAIVAFSVRDASGKGARAELAVYAVDEGVLSLVDYRTPDPIHTFGSPRPLRVATLESRDSLAQMFDPLSGLGLDKGLDGGGGDSPASSAGTRRDFRASAYFNPSVITDDDGKAEVKFKLPDGLTTYRLMAVAVTQADRFGAGESRVTTSRPLMARPALPRFLRAGDSFEASVIVSSRSERTQEVDVSAKLSGVVARGETKRRVTVEPGRSVEVRFAADAPRVGAAGFHFSVESGTERDAVQLERRVHIPLALEAVALYGETRNASAERLGDLSEMRDDTGELTVTTASTALVGLDAGSTQLLEYPYGCTEQLTSKLVPLVAMKDLATDFGLQLPANTSDVVEKTIAKILTHQRYDGGFGFWPESLDASAWATTYALWGLDQASKKGHRVPQSAIDRASQYLWSQIKEDSEDFRRNVSPFVVYVLAEIGKPDAGQVTRLYAARAGLPLYSRALLLSAMVLSKSDPGAIEELSRELEASVRLDGAVARTAENLGDDYAVYLDSNTRTSALVLRALLHAKPDHPLASKLAMGLLREREGGQWRSTQEGAWALLALGDYRKAQERAEPDFTARTFFGDSMIAEQAFRGRSLVPQVSSFSPKQLLGQKNGVLAFQVEGDGKLFYEARLRYARRKLPTDTIDRGFFVERRLRKVTADSLPEALATVPSSTLTSFAAGDLVLADVVVVTPKPRRFVVIDSPLPAGFEAVDTNLAITSDRLRGIDSRTIVVNESDAAMGRAEWSSHATREVRDDRMLFFVDALPAGVFRYRFLARATAIGSFVAPPTKAEEMYAPEIFGRTEASMISIAAP